MDAPTERVSVNGVELAYVERGGGDPVVLVHGSLNDLRSWGSQMGPLAERYRVIAYSRRYHWPNNPPSEGDAYAIEEHVIDLAALLDVLDIEPAHLVGSSYGAMTVLALVAGYPHLARSVVLGEPPLLPWLAGSEDGPALMEAFMSSAWEPAGEALRQGRTEAMAQLFIDGVIGPGTFGRLPPPARTGMLDNAAALATELRTPPETYFPHLTCDDLGRVDVPVLLLDGQNSPRMFRRIQDALAECLPDVERAVIPNASHGMHVGNPSGYNDAVLPFITRH